MIFLPSTDTDYSDATPSVTFTYNDFGQPATITDATGTRNLTYDPNTLQPDTETLDATFYNDHELLRHYQDGTETHGLEGRPARGDEGDEGVSPRILEINLY